MAAATDAPTTTKTAAETPPAGTETTTPPAASPATVAAQTPAAPTTTATAENAADSALLADPAAMYAELQRVRREAGTERVNAKTTAAAEAVAEERKRIAKILDPDSTGAEVTPEQLTHQLTETSARADSAERRAAVLEAAWSAGIDKSKMAFLEFTLGRDTKLAGIPHTESEFGATLTAAIQALISADPSYRTPGAVTTSGAEVIAGGNSTEAVTKAQFDAMSIADRTKLFREDKATYDRLNNS